MKKAAAKSKAKKTASKPAKRAHSRRSKKPVDLVEVRKDITNIVGSEARELAKAVVEEGRKGQLAPVKYLFEMAGLYPPPGGVQEKPEEAALAKTLLDRLGLSHQPVTTQEDDPATKVAGKTRNGEPFGEEECGDSCSASENRHPDNDDEADAGDHVTVPAQINPVE